MAFSAYQSNKTKKQREAERLFQEKLGEAGYLELVKNASEDHSFRSLEWHENYFRVLAIESNKMESLRS